MSGQMKVHRFKVGMTCDGCAQAVQRVLGRLEKEVENVSIDVKEQLVDVKSSLPSEELLKILQKTGKPVTFISSNDA